MSESGSKSSQPLASKQEKDGTEKRGRGRPRKQPPVSPGTALGGSQVGVKALLLFPFLGWEGAELTLSVHVYPSLCMLTAQRLLLGV